MFTIKSLKRISSIIILPGLLLIILTCSHQNLSSGKEENIASMEVFIQGVGLDVQRSAFNADGTYLITSGRNGTSMWDMQANKELINLYKSEAHSSAVSKNGRYLITFSPADYGIIRICDLSNLKIHQLRILTQEQLGYGSYISGIAISDDEKYFALYSNKIRIFDLITLKQVNEIKLKDSHYLFNFKKQGLSFLPGTNELLSVSYDITFSEPNILTDEGDLNMNQECRYCINNWNITTGEQKSDISFDSKFIYSWALSGNGRQLAALTIDKRIQIADLTTGNIKKYPLDIDNDVDVIDYNIDGKIIFAGRDGLIGIYDPDNSQSEILSTDVRTYFHAQHCVDVSISGISNKIAFCNGYDQLIVYNMTSNETDVLRDQAKSVCGAYYNSDSLLNIFTSNSLVTQNGPDFIPKNIKMKQLLGNIYADQLLVDNPNTGEKQIFDLTLAGQVFTGYLDDQEYYCSFSRDGRYAFKSVAGGEAGDLLAVIDLEDVNSDPVILESSNGYGINIKVFDHNQKAIIAGFAADPLAVWDIKTGRQINQLDIQSGNAEAFDFIDQNKCLIGVRGNLRVYDMNTMTVIKTYTPKGYEGNYKDIKKIAFSGDKKYFATGDADGLITIWDFNSENELLSFEANKDWITSLRFSPDGKNIVSGSYNGKSIYVNEVKTGKEIARFVTFSDGEWIIITPEGYFNASDNGAKYLNVRIGNQVYSIDNFYEKYFNPAYVASVLGGKTVEAVSDIRKGVLPPPVVRIISPRPNEEFTSEDITVTVSAKDMGGSVDEIRLYHNGKVVKEETRGMKLVSQRKKIPTGTSLSKSANASATSNQEFTKSYTITLVNGTNTFRAIGFSTDRTESNPAELSVRLIGGSGNVSLHVITVGINKYKNPSLNLNYAQPDARSIVDFFKQKGKGLFRNVDINDLYNEQATKDNILSRLDQLENTNPQDAVLIYLAGHGENIDDKWYFIPYELTYPEREEDVISRGFSSDELSNYIKNIKAQKILVLIDACKSGAALLAFRGFEDRKALSQLSRATGIHVVAASTKDQFASEVQELGHGVFTYTLLQGLNGRAAGSGESITVRKLLGYIEEKLPELTQKYRQEAQYPVVDSKGMDFPLVIKK